MMVDLVVSIVQVHLIFNFCEMIYLDNAATTECDSLVIKEMLPFFNVNYANPSNSNNQLGSHIKELLNYARESFANNLNCLPQQVIWTSGATESNNLILQGVIKETKRRKKNFRPHIITSSIEHKSIINTCEFLKSEDVDISYVKPNKEGGISIQDIEKEINERTTLISIMLANNEIGTINDIMRLSELTCKMGILLHSDATQYFGKQEIDLKKFKVDFLSFSSHKIYGPKGIGGMFVKNHKTLSPLIYGGGQEFGIRSGTLNTSGIIGFAKAFEIASSDYTIEYSRIKNLRDTFEDHLLKLFPQLIVNGSNLERLSNITNITFPIKSNVFLINVINNNGVIACSSGSACDSAENHPSHVLTELGRSSNEAKNSIRFSFGKFNTKKDVFDSIEYLKFVLKTHELK